jgi:hypothetical protein
MQAFHLSRLTYASDKLCDTKLGYFEFGNPSNQACGEQCLSRLYFKICLEPE